MFSCIVDLFTIVVSIYWFITNFKLMRQGIRYVIYYVFWFVFVTPLVLDYIIQKPDYSLLYYNYWGFNVSYNDPITRVIYALFILYLQYAILSFLRYKNLVWGKKKPIEYREILFGEKSFFICICLACLSPTLIIVLSDPKILFIFGWRDIGTYTHVFSSGFYSIFEKISYLGVVSSLVIIFEKYKNCRFVTLRRIISILLLYMNLCIESKRSALFFMFLMAIVVLIVIRDIKVKIIIPIVVILAAIVLWYSIYIKVGLRGYSGFSMVYTTLRIDLFRDDTVKMAIYGSLHPKEIQILDYPFQSYLMQIRYFLILSILAGKKIIPLPGTGYDAYFTAALTHTVVNYDKDYSMTTSLFDEAIANFGFLGIIISAFILACFIKRIDAMYKFEKIYWMGAVILLFMYPLNYVLVYIEFCIIMSIYMRVKLVTRR